MNNANIEANHLLLLLLMVKIMTERFFCRQAFIWLSWPLTPAMNWQSTLPTGKDYDDVVWEDKDFGDKDNNRAGEWDEDNDDDDDVDDDDDD